MNQLLRRAWDALDSFRQAYPENWHEDDEQVMNDLMRADMQISNEKREWVGLTDDERDNIINQAYDNSLAHKGIDTDLEIAKNIEAKLKEKNNA